MEFSGVVLSLGGAALACVGALGQAGRLRRNRWSGIRTRATLQSDAAWLAAHRAAGTPTTLAGAAWLAGGVLLALENRVWLVLFVAGLGLAITGAVVGQRAAAEAAGEK